jgi:predicted O-methyltransferase YrrM
MRNSDYNYLSCCPTLKEVCEAAKVRGETGKEFNSGGSTLNNLEIIYNIMLQKKPARTIEIGMAQGRSALMFAACHRLLGRAGSHQHVAIDPFQSSDWDNTAVLQLNSAQLLDYVKVYEMPSSQCLPLLIRDGISFDLSYVDGSHLFEDVFVDFYFLYELISVGGIILFDDSTFPDVRKVIRFIEHNYGDLLSPVKLQSFRKLNSFEKLKYGLAVKLKRNQITAFQKNKMGCRKWNARYSDF